MMRRLTVTATCLVALLITSGCSDVDLAAVHAEIEVTWSEDYGYPDVLDFGTVTVGAWDEVAVHVSNPGDGNLDVASVALEAPTPELTEDGEPDRLEPGASMVVIVRFTPLNDAGGTNTLLITNSVTDEPVAVPIVIAADGDPIPDIYAEPSQHDFGEVELYQSATQQFTVGNAGFAPLTVDSVSLTGAGADAYVLLDDQVSGVTFDTGLPPSTLTVSFSPHDIAEYPASIEIRSNDPDEDPLVVSLHGEGVDVGGDGPVAVCAVTPQLVHPPFEFANFEGHDSYDTGGFSLDVYDWSLIARPAGSSVSLPTCNNTADCGPFYPDLGGTYTAELYVENSQAQHDTCTVDLEAVPYEDLWIEMYWTESQDDMDLHLLAPGGTPLSNTDCYYSNCVYSSPDWGVAGDPSDDPSLDLDDIPGTGPENINIPNPGSGVYTVFVDDYSGSTQDYQGGNDVTVNVYINGGLMWTDTRTMSGEGPDEYFCTVDWPSGAVTAM